MISGYKELPAGIQKFVPDYDYLIYNISNYTDEEIKGEARIRIIFTMYRDLQKTEDVEELLEIIDKAVAYLLELDDKQTGMDYFETFMRYIFSAVRNLTREDVDEIMKKVETTYPEGSELVMTLADILREEGKEEGKEEGIKKGIVKGKKEGVKEVALEMLKKGFADEMVAEITQLDVKEIKKLEEK